MKQSRKQWRKKKSICGCWPYLLCMAIMLAAIIPTTAYSAEKKQQATEGNAEEVTVEEASEEQQTEERPSVRATTPGLVVTMAGKGATTADNFNVTMDSNNTTTTTIANSAISSLIATKVQAAFPEQATNKQVRVTLAPGMAITNTSANIGSNDANVKEWLNGTITVGAGDKVWDDKTIRMSNSTIIYPFKDSTETVTIPMNVWLQIQTWLFSVGDTAKPAVKVELLADTGDGQGVRAISEVACTTITANPLYPTFTPTQDHELLVAMDTDVAMTSAVTNYEFRINHTLSGQGRYYDSVEWYICVDKEKAVLKGDTMNNFGEVEDLGLDPDDSTKRIYKISLAHGTIGNAPFNLKWNFPSAYFTGGDEITVSTIKVVTKPWGYENTYTYVPGVTDAITNTDADGNITLSRKNLNYTHKFIINSDDLVWVNNSNDTSKPDEDRKGDTARPVHWRNPGFEDMVGILGWYSLGNRKAVDSKPKTVEFHFDSTDIGVTALNIPMPGGKTLSEVQYKIKGDNSWHTATVSLTPTETDPKKLGVVMVTNDSVLGHNIDDYITDFKYVMPYVPANAYITGNDSAVTDKAPHIWGRVLNQMDASKRVKSTIQAYTEGTDPAVTTPFPQNTDIGNIYTDLSETKIGLGISASDTMEQAPNSTFVFSNVTKSPTAEIPNVSPVFYIRDETGCGIEDFSLVNTEGVNLTDTYGIMPELVETTTDATTGKAVLLYKVDTSSIAKNNTGLDKYAAAIGNYVFNGNPDQGIARELTIRYTVTVPTTYRDGSVYHKHQDRVYLSSANKMYDHSLVAGTTIHDPYDVNKDGHITESVAPTTSPYNLVVSNSSTSTYRIYVPPRLNVVTEAKHYNAPEASYTSWQKGEDPLHVNVGMNSGFNVKIRVSNDSSADVTGMKLYQPIPKKGQNWGALSGNIDQNGTETHPNGEFLWSTSLVEALANPDSSKYEIYYGVNITPTDSGVTLDTESFLPAASITDWSAVNCIKIVNKTGVAIAEGESADFVMKCTVDAWDANIDQTTNMVAAKYHQDLTVDGSTYTGWYNGNPTAIEICCGVIEGDVYLDINKNGKLDAIDQIDQKTNIYNGAKVQLYRVGYTHAPMQETTVVDGHYRFADLLRGSGAYEIVIIRPDGVAEKYQLSMQNTIIENDGATHHLFANDSVDSKKAVATNLWAVQKPGNRDNGITEGGNGIYNLLLQNVEHGELRVEKKVKGDLAQTDKEFEFAVKIYSDAAGTILATGDCHYQVYNQDGKENGDPASITNGQGVIKLKHGQYFILCKLPDGYYVRVIETNAGGYQTSIVTQNGTTDTKQNIPADNKTPGNLQISKTKAGDSTLANRVDYTNSRVSPVITGVNMDMGIWLLLAGIIIALLAIVIGGRCHTHRRHRRYGN